MTPIEAANAARELARWLDLVAQHDAHPTSRAEELYTAWSEADQIVEDLKSHLAYFPVTA